MKILLTGANGFLGKVLYSQLISNFSVKTLSRYSGDYIADLSNERPFIADKFDIVIHAAGKAHSFPKSREDRDAFYSVNVQGTKNLLEGLENYKLPKSFVFISTVAVYGVSEGNLINEQTELNAIDPYGQSKLQAEQLVSKWCTRNNVKCTILRLPLVVGLNPPGNLGAMIKGINNGYYFNIAGGSAKKSMVLASDITKYLLKASEIGGIFNLTDGYHPTFFELSENISRQLGKRRPINMPYWLAELFARIGDLFGDKFPLNSAKLHKITSDLTFDDSKAREILGWNPKPVLEGFKLNTNSVI
jgi:nucleoside-diphosphate-sugar epimerase